MTNQVWPLRQEQRLSTRIIEGQHWGKRNVAVDAGDAENLPSSECPVVIESQLIISVGDEVVANVEFRAPSASLAIENVLRRGRFIHCVYRKIRGSIIYGSWQWD
jgi:hypothetical protein